MTLNKLVFSIIILLCGILVFPAAAATDWSGYPAETPETGEKLAPKVMWVRL